MIELRNATASPSFLGAINFLNVGAATLGQVGYHGDNSMSFATNGSERARLDASGNLGLGTTTPANRLTVTGSMDVTGRIGVGVTAPSREMEIQNTGDVELGLKSKDANGRLWTVQSSAATGTTQKDGSFQIIDRTANAGRVLIDSSGNVGINTFSPQARLEVNGDARVDGTITIPSTTRYISYSADDFNILQNAQYSVSGAPTEILDHGAFPAVPAVISVGVHLPDGAVVNQLQALISDTDNNKDIQVFLERNPVASVGSTVILANASSSGAPGTVQITDTASATIDNASFCYHIDAVWDNGNISFHTVRLRYTISSPLP